MAKQLTGRVLRDFLDEIGDDHLDMPVTIEGCDCDGPGGTPEVLNGEIYIGRLEYDYGSMEEEWDEPEPEGVVTLAGEVITPGGNPVCPRCGRAHGLGVSDCDAELMHWVTNLGATHAVVNVSAFHGTQDTSKVTCPICIEHIKERS